MYKPYRVRSTYYLLIFLVFVLFSCKTKRDRLDFIRNGDRLEISLKALSDSTSALQMKVNGEFHSEWPLNYPVYRFDYGDITGDGVPEIAVGVVKTTRFDRNLAKRLFLFRITDDFYIRPLWLGSRVAQPLEDFCIFAENDSVYIRTIEKEQSGKYLVARYYWKGFGLAFNDYLKREITKKQAQRFFAK